MRVRRAGLAIAIAALCLACSGPPEPAAAPTADDARADFEALADRFVDEVPAFSPSSATILGDHRFDDQLDRLSAEARSERRVFYADLLVEIEAIDRAALDRQQQVDLLLLDNEVRRELWRHDVLQEWVWNPLVSTRVAGGSLYGLMARDFAPLEERLLHLASRLEQFPRLFEEIRASLVPERVPKVHAETAVAQNQGVHSILDEQVLPHLDGLAPGDRDRLEAAIEIGRAAVDEHQAWLENVLLPAAKGEFRVGAAVLDAKLRFGLQSSLDRVEIRRRADARMLEVRRQMFDLALEILERPSPDGEPDAERLQSTIEEALEVVYRDRPDRGEVVATAREALERARAFATEKAIVSVPTDPVEIIVMPEFRRGVSVAYCDAPGPLDVGQKTYYAISPLPQGWTPEQDASFLREYNDMSLEVLTIHEAIPGHYLQLAHANRYPSTLRALLASGPFIEGFAVYSEGVMQRQGYLDGDPRFHLILLKWYLRDIANAILDQAVHVDGMTRDEAMDLMTRLAFQEEREAAGKWTRAQLTSGQLSTYLVGFLEHSDLRAEAELAWGDDFDLQGYHDLVLSFGSPPVHYARQLVLDLPIEPPVTK